MANPDQKVGMPAESELKLLIKGFSSTERQILQGAVMLSRRRLPHLKLIADADGQTADVVMVDGANAAAMQWAANQDWLKTKAVIWVDGSAATFGHLVVRRPVQWPGISILLARALEQGPRKTTDAGSTPTTVMSTRRSMLVVDDSLAVRAHLRSLLEARGYLVTDASSAEAGIEAAAKTSYACILMDVLMPGMDGYEACRRIKGKAQSGNGPAVVMLTSKSSSFDRIRGKMAGCDAYLTKPVATADLYDILSRYAASNTDLLVAPKTIANARFGS